MKRHHLADQTTLHNAAPTNILDLLDAKYDDARNRTMKNPHAQALGSLGGSARAKRLSSAQMKKIASEGGKARARKLSSAQLSVIAKKAVAVRERKRAQAKKGENK